MGEKIEANMQPRRTLTPAQIEFIKNYKPPGPGEAARFSKKQLEDMNENLPEEMHFSFNGGGLVRINGEVYTFVKKENFDKTHILGEGSHGTVKLLQNVRNPEDQKALKVIFTKRTLKEDSKEDTSPKKLLDELELLEKLGRGSKQLIKKVGEGGHVSYCGVMDIIPGIKLDEFLRNNPIKDRVKRLEIVINCLEQLDWLHTKGYVHNDVDTGNFMYDPKTGQVKIIDFGEAKAEPILTIKRDLQFFANNVMGKLMSKELFFSTSELPENEQTILTNLFYTMMNIYSEKEISFVKDALSNLRVLLNGWEKKNALLHDAIETTKQEDVVRQEGVEEKNHPDLSVTSTVSI